jgi:hypothetical protein
MGQDDRDYTANLNYHMVMSGLTPSATLADEFCCDAQQVCRSQCDSFSSLSLGNREHG